MVVFSYSLPFPLPPGARFCPEGADVALLTASVSGAAAGALYEGHRPQDAGRASPSASPGVRRAAQSDPPRAEDDEQDAAVDRRVQPPELLQGEVAYLPVKGCD